MKKIALIVLIVSLMGFTLTANAGRSVSGTVASGRTTTGQDKGLNPFPWGMLRVIITITAVTATVKVQCLDEGTTTVFASVTATTLLTTDMPCEQIATDVTAISGATVNSSFLATEN